MSPPHPPPHTTVLIIGGGPSGSFASALLAQEGIDVVCCEAAFFPRYHIGESLLASVKAYLGMVGVCGKVDGWGFHKKPGSAIKFRPDRPEAYTDFLAVDPKNGSWNVDRSQFDDILLTHAAEKGAQVFQGTRITAVEVDPVDGRPCSARWVLRSKKGDGGGGGDGGGNGNGNNQEGTNETKQGQGTNSNSPKQIQGTITFTHLIDCSGRQGLLSTQLLSTQLLSTQLLSTQLLSTQLLHHRRYNATLKNIATWSYWTGDVGVYGRGTGREGAIYVEGFVGGGGGGGGGGEGLVGEGFVGGGEGLVGGGGDGPEGPGWVWFIPLVGKVSVGVVMHERDHTALRRACGGNVRECYLRALARAPNVMQLLKDTTLLDDEGEGGEKVRMASDYSYSATAYAGPGWRLAGDAGAFIDPFFSSGVHLAFNSGLSAAVSVIAAVRGDVSEEDAAAYHDKKTGMAYTRFLLVVLSAYKQLKYQNMDVLSDVNTGDFNAAFDILRPVIQGLGDIDATHSESRAATENMLSQTMDFIGSVLTTSTDDITEAKEKGYVPAHLFERDGRVLGPDEIARLVSDTGADEKTERALRSVNARKPLQLYDPAMNFEKEEVLGMVADLKRGSVGLRTVGPSASMSV